MTDKKTPEALDDGDLDQAAGGLKLEMTDIMITSYQTGGSAVEDQGSGKTAIDYGVVATKDAIDYGVVAAKDKKGG
ncbi:MAG: hypothetical protein AAFN27_05880 [Pseudomonadota bacterium]